ncbi:MAG: potassium transporter TrkG [Anaerovoracaceae bacterium]
MNLNYNIILRTGGITAILVGVLTIPSLGVSLFSHTNTVTSGLIFTMAISLVLGFAIIKQIKPSKKSLKFREGYLSVICSLLVASVLGSFPYIWTGLLNPIDAFFESVAGFTTTSATAIGEPNLPLGLALWKASSHWFGGICILIYLITFLPRLGHGGQQITTAESSNSNLNKIAPKSSEIIKIIFCIYFTLTILTFILISFSKIGIIDSLVYTFSTVSTAAVNLHNSGLLHYNNVYLEIIISIFSILSATSFVFYFYIIKGYKNEVKKNIETKTFILIIIIFTILCNLLLFVNIGPGQYNLRSFREIIFQVISFASTSGYTIIDYQTWPESISYCFLILTLIGGCSASTSGSFKVIRMLIYVQLIRRGFHKRLHPRLIEPVKIGDSIVSAPLAASVTTYGLLFFIILLFSTLLLSIQGLDLETTFSAAFSSLTNIGIGFGKVGYLGEYHFFHPLLKLLLCIEMIVGRLGLYSVFLIAMPSFWQSKRKRNF